MYYILIMVTIPQEDITIVNIYVANIGAQNFINNTKRHKDLPRS